MKDKFKLLKSFGDYKKGKVFDSFGGLVSGVTDGENTINFSDKTWFKLI